MKPVAYLLPFEEYFELLATNKWLFWTLAQVGSSMDEKWACFCKKLGLGKSANKQKLALKSGTVIFGKSD